MTQQELKELMHVLDTFHPTALRFVTDEELEQLERLLEQKKDEVNRFYRQRKHAQIHFSADHK